MDTIDIILNKAMAVLSEVPGILAVVLGGSRARGNHLPDSDIDIGLYYNGDTIDLVALNCAAQMLDDEHRENLITPPGGWGQWVNGGGWLAVDHHPVDIVLRDVERVEQVIGDCQNGVASPHYQTGHPHAFIDAMYMGELAVSKLLWETNSRVSTLKTTAEQYPAALQKALIHLFSFEAEFSLWLAEASASKDDPYYVAGHIVRSVSALNQVLFALNEEYCLNEKKAVKMIDGFPIHPAEYKNRIDTVIRGMGGDNANACTLLRELVYETKVMLPKKSTGHVTATIAKLSDAKQQDLQS